MPWRRQSFRGSTSMSTRSWRWSRMLARRFVNTLPLVFLVRENLLEILGAGVDDVAAPGPVIGENYGHCMDDPTVQALDRASWLTIVPGPANRPSWLWPWPRRGPGPLSMTGAHVAAPARCRSRSSARSG